MASPAPSDGAGRPWRMRFEDLQDLALRVSGERDSEAVLRHVVDGLAARPGVALVRVWVLKPGDVCATCRLQSACADRSLCLHLAASAGTSVTGEPWTATDGAFRRVPLGHRKVGTIAASREGTLICDPLSEEWSSTDWVRREGITSFAGQPLVAGGETLGVLAIFRRQAIDDQEMRWLRIFADQAASTLANARAFTELDRLRQHLEVVDGLLSTLSDVLDIGQVFEQVAAIARRAIPHDMVSLPLVTDDREHLLIHAVAGNHVTFPERVPLPPRLRWLLTEPWDHILHHDLQADPAERELPPARAGYRSQLAVPLRVQGTLVGALDFYALAPHAFSKADALVARRIADHVVLAMTHHRLAEQARVTEELRARESRLELVDDLLKTVTDAGDLKDQFDRISAIAQKVLPHDAMTLPVVEPDGVHARRYAYSGELPSGVPEVVKVPEIVLRDTRDYFLTDDLEAPGEQRNQGVATGFRSALRIPVRIDGRLAGGVSFLSRTPKAFSPADVRVALRIAGRIALALSRELRTAASARADEAQQRATALEARVQALAAELNAVTGYRFVVGESPAWTRVLKQATQVAATDTTTLLLGESGTGKEVVARFVHRASTRSGGPFVALNCAALPEPLLESELFGFERGAFTGAVQAKPGQLEQASGGVLFLDEVGEMSPAVQAKFLRVLQEREFQRLGGTRTLKANVRVVAATNRNLKAAVERGTFREDLYYRLNVFEIRLPPLRERRDDILPLSEAFLKEIARAFGRPPAGIARDARDALLGHAWPGNVRELRNVLERAAILCEGGLITTEHLTIDAPEPAARAGTEAAGRPAAPDTTDLRVIERATIERALQDARHNKSLAAKRLGLTRKQLYVRLRQHGLD
ncbi:MAG: sigma 54-interacting transcriptional regulator [Vicinamibacterales bacterium]